MGANSRLGAYSHKYGTLASWQENFADSSRHNYIMCLLRIDFRNVGRQMYFYYLEWLFVYNQNKSGYLQITTLQFYYF